MISPWSQLVTPSLITYTFDVGIMHLQSYLVDGESVSTEVKAYTNSNSFGQFSTGTLACSPYRLVFVQGNDVTDISLQDIGSIEYKEAVYPLRYLLGGMGIVVGGFFLLLVSVIAAGMNPALSGLSSISWVIAAVTAVAATVTFVYGHLLKRATLKVHTSSKSYKFTSPDGDLVEIGHTVRGYEMKNDQ